MRPCFSSAISCDTIGWQGSHPVSKLPLGSVSNSSAPDKRHGSGESFHRFPSSKFRQKQWLASMKLLNPPVLKYAYVCSDHFTDEDYVRNHTLQSGLLQSTVNKVLKRDAFLEGLGTCEIGVHNLSHFFKKRNSHN